MTPPFFISLKDGMMVRLLASTQVCLMKHHFILIDDTHELGERKCFRVDQVVQIHASNVSLKLLEE